MKASDIISVILSAGSMTRAEITAATGHSMPLVIKYTQQLVEMQILVQESGGGGRTLCYCLNPELGRFLGIVVGRSVQAFLMNSHGERLYSSDKFYLDFSEGDPNPMISIEQAVRQVSGQLTIDGGDINLSSVISIGVAIGGYINPDLGVSHSFYTPSVWHDFNVVKALEEKFGRPTFLMNDVNAAALGEKYFGKGQDYDNSFLVWLGEGTGMGIIVQGELYTGSSYYAGEIGHMNVSGLSELCYCGNTGCLETLTAEGRIIQEYNSLYAQVSRTPSHNNREIESPDIKKIVAYANQGDRLSQRIFREVARALGLKLADLCNVFNPDGIILRGPVIDGNAFLFENVEREIRSRILLPISDALDISYSQEENDSIAKGLAAESILRMIRV